MLHLVLCQQYNASPHTAARKPKRSKMPEEGAGHISKWRSLPSHHYRLRRADDFLADAIGHRFTPMRGHELAAFTAQVIKVLPLGFMR